MATSIQHHFKKNTPEKPPLYTQGFTSMSRNDNAMVGNFLAVFCFALLLNEKAIISDDDGPKM